MTETIVMKGKGTTKTAYCGKCDKPIHAVHQEKCEYCGSELNWNEITFRESDTK